MPPSATGNIPLGGGTRAQKEAGIVDSPDILFKDLTDWSAVELNGAAAYRFNDRDIIRAFADNNVFAYDFLVSHGLIFTKPAPDYGGMTNAGSSAPRAMHAAVMAYPLIQTGRPAEASRPENHFRGHRPCAPAGGSRAESGCRDSSSTQDDQRDPGEQQHRPRGGNHRGDRQTLSSISAPGKASSSARAAAPAT